MQRVLLLTDRYFPEVGGTITWFDNMYRRYRPGSVWIATQNYPDAQVFDKSYVGISLYRASLKRYRFLKPESLILYAKLFVMGMWIVLRHRINVIHVGKVLPEGLVARFIGQLWNIPYIVYAHGEEITIFGHNPAYRNALHTVYHHATAVIANSSFTAEELNLRGVAAQKIVRISPGVDLGTV